MMMMIIIEDDDDDEEDENDDKVENDIANAPRWKTGCQKWGTGRQR